MVYEYINEETKEKIEREFSIKEDIPSHIEENGKKYHRFWGDYTIQIPDSFNALKSYNRPKYGKRSPGEGKRFY